jgi:hypothetical protein
MIDSNKQRWGAECMNLCGELRKLSKGRVIAGEEDDSTNRWVQKFCLISSSEPSAADINHEGAKRHGPIFLV